MFVNKSLVVTVVVDGVAAPVVTTLTHRLD